MPEVTLVGDTAGGVIQDSLGAGVAIGGTPVALAGDSVTAHAPCPKVPSHCSAVTTASSQVTVDGIAIVLAGDPATCGHAATASGGVTVEASP